jgi:hypothetical protein
MTAEFNLPGSSFEEIQKILKGYSHAPEQAPLETLSKLTGFHTSTISRSSKFLNDLGLISGGRYKSATDLGKKLGRALDHGQTSDAQQYWKEAVQTNEKVSGFVTTVRIKGGMTEREFSSHILYVSGQKNTGANGTGARAVVDALMTAGLLIENNGRLTVSSPAVEAVEYGDPEDDDNVEVNEPAIETMLRPSREAALNAVPQLSNLPQIAINIQLHLPETENADVYENLFKALREHLLSAPSA